MRAAVTLFLVGVCSQILLSSAYINLRTFLNPKASEAVELKIGIVQNVPAVAKGSYALYKITVPAGACLLVVRTIGGSGDLDLFVRANSPPGLGEYDTVSITPTNYETVVIQSPKEGVYYFLLDVYADIKDVKIICQVGKVGKVGKRAQDENLLRSLLDMLQK